MVIDVFTTNNAMFNITFDMMMRSRASYAQELPKT